MKGTSRYTPLTISVADIGRLKAEVEGRLLNCEGMPKTWLRVGQDTCCEMMWNCELTIAK